MPHHPPRCRRPLPPDGLSMRNRMRATMQPHSPASRAWCGRRGEGGEGGGEERSREGRLGLVIHRQGEVVRERAAHLRERRVADGANGAGRGADRGGGGRAVAAMEKASGGCGTGGEIGEQREGH